MLASGVCKVIQLCVLSHFSMSNSETLWSVAHQAPQSMGFSRQKHWSGLLCPSLGDLPNPGIKPTSPMSPALLGRFFTPVPGGKPWFSYTYTYTYTYTYIYMCVCVYSFFYILFLYMLHMCHVLSWPYSILFPTYPPKFVNNWKIQRNQANRE